MCHNDYHAGRSAVVEANTNEIGRQTQRSSESGEKGRLCSQSLLKLL